MQPESFNDETLQANDPKPEDIRQSESQVVNEDVRSTTILSRMKTFPISFYAIGSLILLLVMAVICLGGLGYWGYTLGNDLTATRQQLAKLQENYDSLLAQDQKLSADLVDVKAELADTQLELDATKTELATSSQELNKKNKSMKDAAARLVVLKKMLAPFIGDDNSVTNEEEATAFFLDWVQSIEDVNDPALKAKFEDFLMSLANGNTSNSEFFTYLLQTIEADLK